MTSSSRLRPSALRVLAWALIARIALGSSLGAAAVVAGSRGLVEGADIALGLGVLVDIGSVGTIIACLVAQLRFPAQFRDGRALICAIGLASLGGMFDLWTALLTRELLSLAGEGWQMHARSRIDVLQANLLWLGRTELVLGVISWIAIVRSLRVTARAIESRRRFHQARRVMRALILVGAAGLPLSIASTGARFSNETVPIAFLFWSTFVALLLLVAIFAFVDLVQLVFGIARAIEAPPLERKA